MINLFFIYITSIMILTLLLFYISELILKKKNYNYLDKSLPYECGFNSFKKMNNMICIRFFNVAILYLLLDMEITLILPFFSKINLIYKNMMIEYFFCLIFIIIFVLLLIEYMFNGLNWHK